MRPNEIKKKAHEMRVGFFSACQMRKSFLVYVMKQCRNFPKNPWRQPPVLTMKQIRKEWDQINRALAPKTTTRNEITDDMISQARQVPINQVVEFIHTKCHCFNPDHEDKHPSMFHGTKKNIAICPVCGFTADSIKAYQILNGVDFHKAVKELCGV